MWFRRFNGEGFPAVGVWVNRPNLSDVAARTPDLVLVWREENPDDPRTEHSNLPGHYSAWTAQYPTQRQLNEINAVDLDAARRYSVAKSAVLLILELDPTAGPEEVEMALYEAGHNALPAWLW